jgi:acyl-CoA thioester hydrolase
MSHVYETSLRVRYAETDQMAVVYHSNYLVWFEVGRTGLLRQLGFTYRELEAGGIRLPVAEATCRFKHPAHYDDELVIRTRVTQLRGSLLRFGYEVVRRADAKLLATGETVHLIVNRDMQRTRLAGPCLQAISQAAGVSGNTNGESGNTIKDSVKAAE